MAITFGSESQGVKNKYIEALLREGMNTGPIQSGWQGASRLAHALLGGLEMREADQQQKAGPTEIAAILRGLSGGQPPGGPAAPMSPMAAALAGEPPSAPPQAPPNDAPIQPRPVPTMRMPPVGSPNARVASAFDGLPQGGGMPDIPPVTGPRPGGPVPSSPTVMGDVEAEAGGYYPPTNGAGAPQMMPGTPPPSPGLTSGPRPQMAQYQPTPPQAPAMPPQGAPQPGMPQQQSQQPGANLTLPQLTDAFEKAKTPAAKTWLMGLITDRMKNPEYEIKTDNGVTVAVNKRNPQDRHVITDPNIAAFLTRNKADEAYATTRSTEQAKKDVTKPERDAQTARSGGIVVQDIDRALGGLNAPGLPTTGPVAAMARNIPGTNAFNAEALISTIKSNVGFDRLQQMRESSPTGGALGAVTVPELQMLQAAIGNLDLAQEKGQFADNLRRVKNIYLDIIHGKGIGPREPLSFENRGESQQQQGAPQQGSPQQRAIGGKNYIKINGQWFEQ